MSTLSDKEVREKLLARGVEALTDAELLSVVAGPRDGSSIQAVEEAEKLLSAESQTLSQLSRKTVSELRTADSLGVARAARVAASFELGRRALASVAAESAVIKDRRDIVRLMSPMIGSLNHEEMWVVYLTSANRVIERRRVSVGGSSTVVADCKLIVKRALELVASSMILVHNHPSGSCLPSDEDKDVTERLRQAAALFDITLLDHVIICVGGDFSFRAEHLL